MKILSRVKTVVVISILSFSVQAQVDSNQTPYQQIQEFSKTWVGRKYKLGGHTERGIDCSQLTKRFYKDIFNVTIGNNAQTQWTQVKKITMLEVQPGDIMFFRSPDSPTGWHCGIYIGDEKFLHAANRAEGVKVSSIHEPKYIKRFRGVGRVN